MIDTDDVEGGRREGSNGSDRSDPARGVAEEFRGWLVELATGEGSDLHVKVGTAPKLRIAGTLVPMAREPLTHEETEAIAEAIVPSERRARFEASGEVDFAYSIPGVGRFRANVFRQRGSASAVLRKLRFGGPTFAEMNLPDTIRVLSEEHRGLVLVTGPTGSGKTTTLAAMIEHLNRIRQCHIVTIEDPIEVLFHDEVASINQREVGSDTESFLSALRAALRQDPDVILIGEMRDTETVRAALQAAETGHLVLSTLHTVDATETVNRVIDFFPPYQQNQIRLTLAGALKGIVCQRLVPGIDGGLLPCHEILVNTGRVAERIADEDKTAEIHDVIAEGDYYGMVTFDRSLLNLVRDGRVTIDAAMAAASNTHDFRLQLQQAGVPVGA
ncbi:MAG TPA: PilT/PilU family type 4a pilus ATPase [Actinomycetota bacterium]|nr:PilT/PilU family type 4a pilus ATPase [Actinomycetota bacterium]